MSAFVVEKEVINSIMNYVYQNRNRAYSVTVESALNYRFCRDNIRNKPVSYTDQEILTMLGQRLWDGNVDSVNYRYSRHGQPKPKEEFDFKPSQERISQAQFFKYLDCLDYQSCELEDYYTNQDSIFWDIYTLRLFGERRTSGYEEARW